MTGASSRAEWQMHVGVAVGYGLLYLLIHPLSTAHWPIHTGVRLACLLLFPYRFWPALLAGEAVSNFCEVYPCLDSLGLAWVIARSIPPFIFVMPIVWWCRTYVPPLPARRVIDIKALIICVLLVSLGGMLYSTLAGFVATPADGSSAFGPSWVILFFLGPYLAILSVTPWVLMIGLDYRRGHLREQVKKILASKLTLEIGLFLVPLIVLLEWPDIHGNEQIKLLIPMAMFVPLTWLTLKHGWRGAAVGCPIVIACIALPVPLENLFEEKLFPTAAQVFLVLSVTGLFALGARISEQLTHEQAERRSALNVQRLARQSIHIHEQRMRRTSRALEYLAGNLHMTNAGLFERMRRVVPNVESHAFYKQAMTTQSQMYRLAESMHPLAWRERGLPAALNETIARALDEAGIAYRCDITGRGFTRLAPSVLAATYRTACEAVVYMCARLACTSVHLTLRGGETNGRRWVVLRVEGTLEPVGTVNAVYPNGERHWLPSTLGASALELTEIRDQVSIFDGILHTEVFRDGLRITALLHDAMHEVQRSTASVTPLRLWVK